jgi:hypothetical protein
MAFSGRTTLKKVAKAPAPEPQKDHDPANIPLCPKTLQQGQGEAFRKNSPFS